MILKMHNRGTCFQSKIKIKSNQILLINIYINNLYIAIHYYPLIAKLIEADNRMRLNKVCSIIIRI